MNNGTGYFRDATDEYGLNKNIGRSECSILGDINNDGYLDYFSTDFVGSNHLYINKEGAKFIDETNFAHLKSNGTSISAAFGDINNDGFLDLYVGNWANENKMYLNNGDGTFRDFTSESGTGDGIFKETNSVLFADFNNDGNLDLFIGNRAGNDKLFINDGKGHFTDISKECGIDSTLWTYGAAFGNFNNDGWIDLFIAYLGGIKIYKNLGIVNVKLKFKDFTNQYIQPVPSLNGYNTSVVTFDVGRDGDIDVFSGQYAGVGHFYKNLLNDGRTRSNYIEVKIAGSESNRSGVGTKIKLFRNHKLIGYREVNAGNGYASSSSKIQHFGLPSVKGNYTLEVFFPASKILKKIKVASNSFIIVHEHEGFVEGYYLLKKNILRYIFSNEFIFEIIKFIFLVIIVSLFVTYFGKKIKFLLGTETYKKIFHRQKILIVLNSAVIYIFVLLLIIISKSVFFNPVAYINNSHNIFMNDLIPYIVTFLFLFFTLKTKYDNRLKRISSSFLLENLFLSLKKFDHGEGMLMNINRLSLLIQNIGYTQKSSNVKENPVFKRLELAIEEFKTTVYPELIKISIILKDIEFIFKQNFKKNKLRFSALLLRYTKDLKNSLGKYFELYNQISARKDLSRKKTEILDNIQNLKNIVYNLSSETNKQFGCNVNDTINSVITKFNYNYGKTLQIGFNNYNGNITALIPSNELSEVVTTIFLNSVEEFDLLNKKDKLLNVTCSKNNTSVIILIEDNGRGVSENLRNKIFEEGFSTKDKGHGFGLLFSKKCIEKFGGKIYCEKSELGGTKFVIELIRVHPL